MFSTLQSNLTAEFDNLHQSMSSLAKCVDNVETRANETILRTPSTPSSMTSSGSELEASGGKRKRQLDLEIQVTSLRTL